MSKLCDFGEADMVNKLSVLDLSKINTDLVVNLGNLGNLISNTELNWG